MNNPSSDAKRRIYLVSPRNPDNFWTMQRSVEAVGAKTLMPNAALATLAALTPEEVNVEYLYCDENIAPIDFSISCDLVAVTGYSLHAVRMAEICETFRQRQIPVALGGIFATLYPERAVKMADHLFVGEGEYTWPQFLREWTRNNARPCYTQETHIDMKDSPPPDWTHIDGGAYLYFTVQTSRGCPNNCDFCDAVRVVGRKYRTKSIGQIISEIENAHQAGAETVFFSEDNFFVNRSFTKALLSEIIQWNTAQTTPLSFAAQATIQIGKDEEILKLLADARFSVIFLGLESIRKTCLAEVNKGHLFQYDPVQSVKQLSAYGILPFVGLIVGFDHDDTSTFGELKDFLDETATPLSTISILNAPENTTLYERMKQQGRLKEDFSGVWHFSTNIVPKSMPLAELIHRHRMLFQKLYEPAEFERRALAWLSRIRYFSPLYKHSKMKPSKMMKLFHITKFYLFHESREVRNLYFRMLRNTWKISPRLFKKAVTIMSQYCHYYDFVNNAAWQNAGTLPSEHADQSE